MKNVSVSVIVAAILVGFSCADAPHGPPDNTRSSVEQGPAASLARPDAQNPLNPNDEVPLDWVFRPDRADREYTVGTDSTADVFFVNMTPGWHLTSGPAGIYYHPASTATHSFQAEMKVYLFDPGTRREGFGLLFGGKELDSDSQSYGYFLVRQGGEFLIKTRRGNETETVQDWTPHDAIDSYSTDGGQGLNLIAMQVDDSEVSFSVNGETVASIERDRLPTDGIVGFRVNHGLNLHVSSLTVENH